MFKKHDAVLSIISPAYNEQENIIPLVEAFDKLKSELPYPIELIIVDDGSTDGTAERARSMTKIHPFVQVVSYSGNRGKTYAVSRGADVAKGKYIVIFDSDLQFDPKDIPPMVDKLMHGADLVAGYKIGKYQKPLVSRIYNFFGRILFNIPVRDMNAMKAMKHEVLKEVPFRPDWHRYIVAWAHKQGFRIEEHPVNLRPRLRGISKYKGIGRILIGTFDMLSVWFQLTFARRPMLFFGTAGLLTFMLALLLGIVAIVLRYGYGLGFRPLLTLIAMLANMGLILLIGGFLGEMIEGLIERVNRMENSKFEQETEKPEPAFRERPYRPRRDDHRQDDRRDDRYQKDRKFPRKDRPSPQRQERIPEEVKQEPPAQPIKSEKPDMPLFKPESGERPEQEKQSEEMDWGRTKRKAKKR